MPKRKLTDAFVQTVKASQGQIDYWDAKVEPFALRVSYGGAKSWLILPRILQGGVWKQTRVTLGRYPAMSLAEAREMAEEALKLASQGKDPRELRAQKKSALEEESRNTFGALADEFLAKYVKRKALRATTARDYNRFLKLEPVIAGWQKRPVVSITRRDVLDALDAIVDRRAAVGANRFLAAIRRFFGWCAERDILQTPPTDRVKPPTKEKKKERELSPAEIGEVYLAMQELGGVNAANCRGDIFGAVLMILLLTGQRRGEVAGMRWDELQGLDGEAPFWELPGSRTKNHLPHVLPLAPQVVEILRSVPRIARSPFVFTTTGDTAVSGFSKAKTSLDAIIAARRKKARISAAMPRFTVHDLRRTVSTRLHGDLGTPPHIVEAVLNHVSGFRAGVAGTYNRASYLEDKRSALAAWAEYVDSLAGNGKAGNVVPLRAAGRGANG
jgi:integrase